MREETRRANPVPQLKHGAEQGEGDQRKAMRMAVPTFGDVACRVNESDEVERWRQSRGSREGSNDQSTHATEKGPQVSSNMKPHKATHTDDGCRSHTSMKGSGTPSDGQEHRNRRIRKPGEIEQRGITRGPTSLQASPRRASNGSRAANAREPASKIRRPRKRSVWLNEGAEVAAAFIVKNTSFHLQIVLWLCGVAFCMTEANKSLHFVLFFLAKLVVSV
jgi:hypothetical protein